MNDFVTMPLDSCSIHVEHCKRLIDHAQPIRILPEISAFPQHYYVYSHNLKSVSNILAEIQYDDAFLLFACEDDCGIYLQVGLIGIESYPLLRQSACPKIVYGRKWRIDADMPTPEIVQTAFLAIQKAKEHELRELFTLCAASNKQAASPFSCHQDVDLLQLYFLNSSTLTQTTVTLDNVNELTSHIRLSDRPLIVECITPLPNSRLLIDAKVDAQYETSSILPEEFKNQHISWIVDVNQPHSFYYEALASCISISNKHVAEQFTYKGFARFSEQLNPLDIAVVSLKSRPYSKQASDLQFSEAFRKENFQIDANRVPAMGRGVLRQTNQRKLETYKGLTGFLPNELFCPI